MATSPHLAGSSTSSAKHLRAISYNGANHLLALKTATYTNKEIIVTPSDARYAIYCYGGVESGESTDGATMASATYNGINSKTVNNWQVGYKAMCTYYGRGNVASIDPANTVAPRNNQRSECCCLVCAYKFNLKNIPSIYTLSSGKVMFYKPSLLQFRAPVLPFTAYYPLASDVSTFENFWTMYLSFAPALAAPGTFYTSANQSYSMFTLADATVAAGTMGVDPTSRVIGCNIHNLWSFDSLDSSPFYSSPPMNGYGFIPVLDEQWDGGIWVNATIDSTPLGVISANRDEVWVHAGIKVANAFDSSSVHIGAGFLVALYAGGLALKLTFNGG